MKTRLKTLAKAALPILTGACILSASSSAEATLLIDESFGGPALPSDWTVATGSGSAPPSIAFHNGTNWLYMARTDATQTRNAIYYTGTGLDDSLTDGQVADFTASVILNTGNIIADSKDGAFGMVVKGTDATSYNVGADSYYITFRAGASETNRGLAIYSNVAAHTFPVSANRLAFDGFEKLEADADVLLRVSSIGSVLSASLWSMDANGNALDELASVTYTEASTAAGYVGLRSGSQSSGVTDTYFRDFKLEAIPEPATALLLLPAGALLLYWKRRTA